MQPLEQKVIFLDIDGVLNTFHFGRKAFTNKYGGFLIIDPQKMKILKKICDLTSCKVVLSTGWKDILDDELTPQNEDGQFLLEMFKEYDIPLMGKTSTIPKELGNGRQLKYWKEYEIFKYLSNHPEIKHFCIIDDCENELESLQDYLVKTEDYLPSEENEGLLMEHISIIKMILEKDLPI